jgi:hypothetical protein
MAHRGEKKNGKHYRKVGPEGIASPGDVRDRFRGAYKPGAREAPRPGLRSPAVGIKKIGEVISRVRRRPNKV